MIKIWYTKFVNSTFWFNVYYRHTKKHKAELKEITNRITKTKLNRHEN